VLSKKPEPRWLIVGEKMNASDSILVVSSKNETLSSYTNALIEMGFKVHSAKNVREALDHIQIRNYALLVISIDAPKEADVSQIAWLRSIRRNLPILLMASRVPRKLIPEFKRAGMSEFLFKPVRGKQLTTAVERLVPGASYGVL
jgi:DNA-binding NtrC family response regulator